MIDEQNNACNQCNECGTMTTNSLIRDIYKVTEIHNEIAKILEDIDEVIHGNDEQSVRKLKKQ